MTIVKKKNGITKIPEFAKIKWANVTSIFALIIVFGRSVFISYKIIGALFFALIFCIGALAFSPFYYAYGTTNILCLYLISGSIYGSIMYSFRKSTLFENIKETNLSKFDVYLSIFIIMFTFTALIYLFIILFFIIGLTVESSLFSNDWFFNSKKNFGSEGYAIGMLNAQLMIWWFIAFILLNFSLFYFFQNLVGNEKSFYCLVFIYTILLMLYGHALYSPYIIKSFVLVEKYPLLDFINRDSGKNLHDYVNNIKFRTLFLIPNHDYLINTSYYIEMSSMLAEKAQTKRVIFIIMNLLTPHYWIDIFSANVMKSTCLSAGIFNPTIDYKNSGDFWTGNNHQELENFIESFPELNYTYSLYNFDSAKIWSLKNDIGWVLGMYLWIAYFILYYFMGTTISRIKNS